jgi:hypothetical protein
MGAAGRERGSVSAGNNSSLRQSADASGAQSGAHRDQSPDTDPELARLIEAWPSLTPEQRKRIMIIAGEAEKAG